MLPSELSFRAAHIQTMLRRICTSKFARMAGFLLESKDEDVRNFWGTFLLRLAGDARRSRLSPLELCVEVLDGMPERGGGASAVKLALCEMRSSELTLLADTLLNLGAPLCEGERVIVVRGIDMVCRPVRPSETVLLPEYVFDSGYPCSTYAGYKVGKTFESDRDGGSHQVYVPIRPAIVAA